MPAEPPSAAPSSSNNASLGAFFALDPRVYFSKESETWRYEADDGEEMEYDVAKGAWVPVVPPFLPFSFLACVAANFN